jgi:hypothetical protein
MKCSLHLFIYLFLAQKRQQPNCIKRIKYTKAQRHMEKKVQPTKLPNTSSRVTAPYIFLGLWNLKLLKTMT